MTTDPFSATLERSIEAVRGWVERHNFKGFDPADGNASFLHHLTFGQLFPQRILQQLVLRSPWNIRPLMGVPELECAPARGYMAAGYTKLHVLTGDQDCGKKARLCLDWLIENKSPFYKQFTWGNNFNYATRTGKRPRFEPIIVWTSLIGQAFFDGYEQFNDQRYLDVARSACEWILGLPKEKTSAGACLSYVAYKQVSIHNSNMLGAALLARVGTHLNNEQMLQVAREAIAYSCFHLREDGSWWYGEKPMHHWVDNFHTGYNLECLKQYMEYTGERECQTHLERGLDYFKKHFFESDGAPKYYHNERYPIDIQSASQAIETLACLADEDAECIPLGRKVAEWTIRNMQDRDGHFYYRDLGWKKVKTPMIHWGQGTMFKALISLLERVKYA
jgi:rhamnogalacturonyl hydrolase YesR